MFAVARKLLLLACLLMRGYGSSNTEERCKVARAIRNWLLRQLNSKNVLDCVTVTVKLAVEELGAKTVASELRRVTKYLEKTGNVPGWRFPKRTRDASAATPEIQKKKPQEASQTALRRQAV